MGYHGGASFNCAFECAAAYFGLRNFHKPTTLMLITGRGPARRRRWLRDRLRSRLLGERGARHEYGQSGGRPASSLERIEGR